MYKNTFLMQDGDIVIDTDLIMIDGQEELRQNIENRLGINKNEWYLDTTLGLDYSMITGKRVDDRDIDLAVRDCCLQDDRVDEVREVNIKRDSKTRTADINLLIIDGNEEETEAREVLSIG